MKKIQLINTHRISKVKMRNSHNEDNNDLNNNISYSNSITTYTTSNPKQTYQEKANKDHMLDKRIRDVNLKINKLKDENIKVSKLREEYEQLSKLQKDIKEFNIKKELEKEQFCLI